MSRRKAHSGHGEPQDGGLCIRESATQRLNVDTPGGLPALGPFELLHFRHSVRRLLRSSVPPAAFETR